MHIVEAFGRIFISTLFIVEAIRKILFKEETIFYMEEYGVPEILFYPSLIFELVFVSPINDDRPRPNPFLILDVSIKLHFQSFPVYLKIPQ